MFLYEYISLRIDVPCNKIKTEVNSRNGQISSTIFLQFPELFFEKPVLISCYPLAESDLKGKQTEKIC